jgi:hypothetical protein
MAYLNLKKHNFAKLSNDTLPRSTYSSSDPDYTSFNVNLVISGWNINPTEYIRMLNEFHSKISKGHGNIHTYTTQNKIVSVKEKTRRNRRRHRNRRPVEQDPIEIVDGM